MNEFIIYRVLWKGKKLRREKLSEKKRVRMKKQKEIGKYDSIFDKYCF